MARTNECRLCPDGPIARKSLFERGNSIFPPIVDNGNYPWVCQENPGEHDVWTLQGHHVSCIFCTLGLWRFAAIGTYPLLAIAVLLVRRVLKKINESIIFPLVWMNEVTTPMPPPHKIFWAFSQRVRRFGFRRRNWTPMLRACSRRSWWTGSRCWTWSRRSCWARAWPSSPFASFRTPPLGATISRKPSDAALLIRTYYLQCPPVTLIVLTVIFVKGKT